MGAIRRLRGLLGLVAVLAGMLCAACGASKAGPGPRDAAPNDAARYDAPKYDATACGDAICRAGQVCVVPCCQGVPPSCIPPTDAGTCPVGAIEGCCDEYGPSYGCYFPCIPAPPFCTVVPPSCGPNPTCDCIGGCDYPSGSYCHPMNGVVQCICY